MPEVADDARGARVSRGVVVAAWIAAEVAYIEPLQAAMLNWDELTIGFLTMLLRLAPIALVVFAVLAPIVVATCWLAPTRALALWVALCVAMWAQGDLFVWHYGTFDGAPLDWSAHRGKAWFEAVAWFGAVAAALWRPAWPAKHALRILAAIVALQGAGLAAAAIENSPFADKSMPATRGSSRASELAALSSNGNAIVIVLDMVQSDFFAEAMHSDELAAQMPKGFVYYRNAVSLYTSTQFSLQSILTSRAVPDSTDGLRWRAEAMKTSLPAVLARRGFDSRLASISPALIECRRPIPGLNCTRLADLSGPDSASAFESAWRRDVSLLFRLGLFRLAPHWLKSRVYDAGQWGVPATYPALGSGASYQIRNEATRTDIEAFDKLTASVRVEDAAPRFRFVHLNGAHYPAALASRCEAKAVGDPRERAVSTTGCMLRKLYRFFDAIEAAGVYDEALIIVVSDHGYPWGSPIDPSVAEPPLPEPGAEDAGALEDWGRGVPLFLMKLPGARGSLQISDRPVSLCDVPATVLDALQLEDLGSFECGSILDSVRHTPRWHYRYPSYSQQNRRPRSIRYSFTFDRIRIDGHSWHSSSWIREAVPRRSSTR